MSMTPDQMAASGSESANQSAFFMYCAVAENHGFAVADRWAESGKLEKDPDSAIDELHWIHAIQNGGARGDDEKSRMIRGARMKMEGVKNGVPDVFFPHPINGWHGLYIEFKRPSLRVEKNKHTVLREEQADFRLYAISQHYQYAICFGWKDGVDALKKYLGV